MTAPRKRVEAANAAALAVTLAALRELGRLEAVDDALVALCESTARAVDESPGRASLVKEYRECLVVLSGLGSEDDSALDVLLARLGGPAVGDEETSGT